ncbi:uncharacterized protein LOC124257523 [Haliotis rubra]|uniref:uncharacterized protein LOC124257523 n=1 Tax=Haliotis rubra TaxID=36100 RepID=UPI001EE5EFE7|nr:uncharacterized protein LOC124257523 [Haliotis rubra]
MVFDLVLMNTLPTNYATVVNVDGVRDCTHACVRMSTCGAIAFTHNLTCYLYDGSIVADPSATPDMELLIYNFQRNQNCNGTIPFIPGHGYRGCPIGSGFIYEVTLQVCYKRFSSSSPADQDICIQEGGSDLMKIDTQEKQDFFKLLIPAGDHTYIRGDRNPSTGEWAYWEEGIARPMPPIDWSPGQPNGETSGQNCLAMDSNGLMDTTCHYCDYILCEYFM